MLSRQHRFHGRGVLARLYQRGQTLRGNGISIKVQDSAAPYRVAVVVSKKVSKRAVVRNRIRRRIFEYLRTQPVAPLQGDIAVLVYDEAFATMPAEQLSARLDPLLAKLAAAPSGK